MLLPLLTIAIRYEHDTVVARQRSRQIARLLGFDPQDQTRIATAVSEIARNAFRYAGGGRAEFSVEGSTSPQLLIIRVSDQGPGVRDLERILEGRYTSQTGMGLGITGARRLMDHFEIHSETGQGTTVWLKKVFPRRSRFITRESLAGIADQLAAEKPHDPLSELQAQNQELMRAMDELRKRQEDLSRVNRELEDTNRGVVALYAELDEKADHLRRADELKSKFLSNMSHEFRSPLNSILALSRLLIDEIDGQLNREQQQQVGYIRKAASDLYELVNDLLDLAKVEAGKVEVKPTHFEVANLFGALRGMLRPLFLNQSVTLAFDSAADLPPMYSDEGKISQVLRNFISNALKFTERGEVRVAATHADGRTSFSVADTGIGIAKEDVERIFQDFTQIDSPIQKRVKGTGLGLPLSRKLAHLLGGDVRVVSEPGIGSTFTFDVPTIWRDTADAPAVIISDNPSGLPVLVVENSPETVLIYSKWLRNSEFQLIHAINTRDAAQKIDIHRPIAIILDILLSGEDSWNLLASIKGGEATRHIPVAVISTVEDRAKGFGLGADEYLLKPVSHEELLLCLRRMISPAETPGRILIIDDNERDRYLLKRWLRNSKARIAEAHNGPEGIAKARVQRPQLIFLDLSMPEMDGFEVLEALRADPRTQSITVVVNTSATLSDLEKQRLSVSAQAIVLKEQLAQEGGIEKLRAQLGETGELLM